MPGSAGSSNQRWLRSRKGFLRLVVPAIDAFPRGLCPRGSLPRRLRPRQGRARGRRRGREAFQGRDRLILRSCQAMLRPCRACAPMVPAAARFGARGRERTRAMAENSRHQRGDEADLREAVGIPLAPGHGSAAGRGRRRAAPPAGRAPGRCRGAGHRAARRGRAVRRHGPCARPATPAS